jgi:F0F1-type ATP synthase membrane subunit b/b'
MNIVQMILKLLSSSDVLSKIASALGIDQEQAVKAVNAAVPTLLAALTGAASKPEGGTNLANVLAKQDAGVLDNLSSLFSGGGAAAASQGSNLLGSLLGGLGGGALGQISSVLSRFTGVNEGAINKMLGLLAPVVLGAIKKQSTGLDAAGIARMLTEQKGNIASALPSGLGSLLSSAVPGLSSVVGDASRAASSAARTATTEVKGAARGAEAAGSPIMKWLVPLLLLVLAFFLLPKMCRTATETAPVVKEKAAEAIPAETESAKLISEATGLIKDATDGVASIKDEASATAVLPKLQDISTKLGGLQSQRAKLPQPVQKTVSDALRPLIAKLREAVQPVLALPVVGAKVKPVVDEMLGQLDKLVPAGTAAAAAPKESGTRRSG